MASVSTMPAEGQILVNIEDMSLLKDIRKAISMIKGVEKVTVIRSKKACNAKDVNDFSKKKK